MPYCVTDFVNCFLWKRTFFVLHFLYSITLYCWPRILRPAVLRTFPPSGGRFHFRKYLSTQRQGKVNFRVQSVNQGCLNLTSVPIAEQQWFNEIEAWKRRLKWGEMVRENTILVCVQLNKLPVCKTGHSTAFPNIHYSCISQNWKRCQFSFLPCLYFNGSRRSPSYSRTQTHKNQTAPPVDRSAWKKLLAKQEHTR